MAPFNLVLTDFERTLVRLFEDAEAEKNFYDEVWSLCTRRGVPTSVVKAAGASPYSLWMNAYRWKTRHDGPLYAEVMYHALTRIAIKHEMGAAEFARLFDDVQPVLERFKIVGIPVVIVSNNATEAEERVLINNRAEGLIDYVVGREYTFAMVGNLKPKPLLLYKALKRSQCRADTALLVGDSIDDMKAGRRARIRFRVGVLQHSTASRRQLRRAGAHLVLNRFRDLQQLIPAGDVSRIP